MKCTVQKRVDKLIDIMSKDKALKGAVKHVDMVKLKDYIKASIGVRSYDTEIASAETILKAMGGKVVKTEEANASTSPDGILVVKPITGKTLTEPTETPKESGRYILQGKFEANKDQKELIDKAVTMFTSSGKEPRDNILVVQGKGGTGKSTTIGRAVELASKEHGVVFYGATITHTAKEVLIAMTATMDKGKVSTYINTIASALKTMSKSTKWDKTLPNGKSISAFSPLYTQANSVYDKLVIVIDEVSMVSQKELDLLVGLTEMAKGQIKLVLMGDYHQLPIVVAGKTPMPSDVVSPALNPILHGSEDVQTHELIEQMRQKDGTALAKVISNAARIVEETKVLRAKDISRSDVFADVKDDETLVSGVTMREAIVDAFAEPDAGKHTKIIGFNKRAAVANGKLARGVMFGMKEALDVDYVVGKEQLMLYATADQIANTGYTNGKQFTVVRIVDAGLGKDAGILVNNKTNPDFPKDKDPITIKYKPNVQLEILTLSSSTGEEFTVTLPKGMMKEVAVLASTESIDVDKAYSIIMDKHTITTGGGPYINSVATLDENRRGTSLPLVPFYYAYAMTSYKSQGQTIDTVIFDPVVRNKSDSAAYKEFQAKTSTYTAVSRAKKKLYIAGDVMYPEGIEGKQSPKAGPTETVQGIEINSRSTNQLAKDLTNAHYKKEGFGITPSGSGLIHPSKSPRKKWYNKSKSDQTAEGVWGTSVEAWYKTNNAAAIGMKEGLEATAYDVKLMQGLIVDKLTQYPKLVAGITANGGSAFLEASTHSVGTGRWSTVGENLFIKTLLSAYNEVVVGKPTETEVVGTVQATPEVQPPQTKNQAYTDLVLGAVAMVPGSTVKAYTEDQNLWTAAVSGDGLPPHAANGLGVTVDGVVASVYTGIDKDVTKANLIEKLEKARASKIAELEKWKKGAGKGTEYESELVKAIAAVGEVDISKMSMSQIISRDKSIKSAISARGTLLHEAWHVLTLSTVDDVINNGGKNSTAGVIAAVNQIKEMYNQTLRLSKAQDSKAVATGDKSSTGALSKIGQGYWKTSLTEFVAEVMGNPDVMFELNKKEYSTSTNTTFGGKLLATIHKLIKAIGSQLGIDINHGTIADEVIKNATVIATEAQTNEEVSPEVQAQIEQLQKLLQGC